MNTKGNVNGILLLIVIVSALFRLMLAGMIELGNDEVYYVTYSLFPDFSHFDHPPMVGWVIQLFTLNNHFSSELMIRLGAIISGSLCTIVIFKIGELLKDTFTGLYAAILFNSSIYCMVIAGTFILPDSPQLFFWLTAMFFFINALKEPVIDKSDKRNMILAGLATGLAMLSKYTSVFLWFGAFMIIILYRREWLRQLTFYLSALFSALLFIPVIIWNFQNNFISFIFQGQRIQTHQFELRPDLFFSEIFGEFLYQSPIVFVLMVLALIYFFRRHQLRKSPEIPIILWFSIPLIATFWISSWFRSTLPHWTGPGYTGLLVLTAMWLREQQEKQERGGIPGVLKVLMILMLTGFLLFIAQVKWGFLTDSVRRAGLSFVNAKNDPSLDLYGWHELNDKFAKIYQDDLEKGTIKPDPVLLSWRWFPAANLDYYVARPNKLRLYAFGKLDRIHKYAWINHLRGEISTGSDAYFICSDRDKKNPYPLFRHKYEKFLIPDTIRIVRNHFNVYNFYVYRLKNLQTRFVPGDISHKEGIKNLISSSMDRPIE